MRGSRRAKDASGHPQPDPKPPACPRWLDKEARAKWKALVPELSRLGLLTCVDGDVLCVYCEAFSSFRRAVETLRREGETFKTKKGYVGVHPAVAIRNAARHTIKNFAALFGLDPSSRARLSVPQEDEVEDDPIEALFKKRPHLG
jgi:P27 family predicted phage terminase small subunit